MTFGRSEGYGCDIITAAEFDMFKDLFDFKKQRTLKESIGFYLFYGCLAMGLQGFVLMLGL